MRFLLLLCFIASSAGLFGQCITVLDPDFYEPVPNVVIRSKAHQWQGVTDSLGRLCINGAIPDTASVEISHVLYETRYLKLSPGEDYALKLIPKARFLKAVSISASRWGEESKGAPMQATEIGVEEMRIAQPQTTADLLDEAGSIFIQKSQLGGGSPMIRGFAANRVLLVIDGVRMNNAIYRSGNLQNVISLDPKSLERVQVWYGPASTLFGSDALGGVMHFRTLDPRFSANDSLRVLGRVGGRFSSANTELGSQLDLNLGGKRLASRSLLSLSQFGHLRSGSANWFYEDGFGLNDYRVERKNAEDILASSHPLLQEPSAYSQLNFTQKLSWRASKRLQIDYGFYYSTSSDIPRYDRLIETRSDTPRFAEWYYGPQRWLMNRLGAKYQLGKRWAEELRLTVAQQRLEESRIDRRFESPLRRRRAEGVVLHSANLDFRKKLSGWQLFYGAELTHNHVESQAERLDLSSGLKEDIATRYPDEGSQLVQLGLYASSEHKLGERSKLGLGLRYTQQDLNANFNNTSFYQLPFNNISLQAGAFSYSASFQHFYSEEGRYYLNASSGFRAPNVDDVAKVFDSEPGAVVVPNAGLLPEMAYSFELGTANELKTGLSWELSLFFTWLDNMIVRRSFQWQGQDSISYDGELSRVQANTNAGQAYIYGFAAQLSYAISSHWELKGNLNYTYGEEEDQEALPVRHVAPLFGRLGLGYKANRLSAQLFARFQGSRSFDDLAPSEQAKAHIYSVNGSPAWYTLSFLLESELGPWTFTGGVENIFDVMYRPYSWGLNAPGRNWRLGISYRF